MYLFSMWKYCFKIFVSLINWWNEAPVWLLLPWLLTLLSFTLLLYWLNHCTLQTEHFKLLTTQYTLHTDHNTVLTAHSTVHTVHGTLHTAHCTLHTAYLTLHTAHYSSHTAHLTLHTTLLTSTAHFIPLLHFTLQTAPPLLLKVCPPKITMFCFNSEPS